MKIRFLLNQKKVFMKKSCMKSTKDSGYAFSKYYGCLLCTKYSCKGCSKTWKVVTNAHTVVDWIYNISGDGIFVGGKDDKSFLLNANLEIISKNMIYL